jgi:hypothetical protein
MAHGDVCILHTDDALLDEIEDLSVERRLKPLPTWPATALRSRIGFLPIDA